MNGHAAADKDEANCGMHHSLREQMGQLVDRERVLCSENDQLRAQLVEMKEQEKEKYDDLMVQYRNMKSEHRENGGLDNEDTSNNQVTVKTEWDDEEVKVEIKEEDDEDSGWDRCVVKKEEVEDQIEDWIKREIKEEEEDGEMLEVKEEIKEEDEEKEDGEPEIDDIEGWAESNRGVEDECGSVEKASMDTTLTHPTGQSQNASKANESIEVCVANLSRDQHNTTTLNEPNEVTTVTQSAQTFSPQTSTGHGSSRTALDQQTTVPTQKKATKRKQQTSKQSAKRSKRTIEEDEGQDEEDGEDIANDDREEAKVKVLHLNCTQSNCNVKLDSLDHLHNHLSTVHQLSPLQCFATNCNARFDNRIQIRDHIKLSHSRNTRFICALCPKEYDSQHKAYKHWYRYHQTGQFECNLVSDCAQVTDTRRKMQTHQQTAHHSQSKHFQCTQPGCTASFAIKAHLKQHESIHLDRKPFHCIWLQCSHRTNRRAHLIKHIRTQHFGLPKSMKEQMAKNIVDLRDPNEYVRVVVDE